MIIKSTPPGKTIDLLLNQDLLLANIKVSPYLVIERNTVQGEASIKELLNIIQVNLSDPKAKCVFLYRWFWKDGNNFNNVEIWGVVETTTEWGILLAQDAINYEYLRIWGYAGYNTNQAPQLTLNGVFDCETAQATLLPAQIVRGTGVGGDKNYWPMGKEEFTWCMEYSIPLGTLIENSWAEAGLDITQAYKFLNPNYSIVVGNDTKDSFISAPVPNNCNGITSIHTDTNTNTVVGTKNKEVKYTNWPLIAGILAGGTLLTLVGFSIFRNR